eukprot:TRINITY_DN14063_c0_g1_i1.p1 TRINITY_DN14063_c0_g1~~TRINITY_DN14063_c0_g1_i1.p1  ORF type:complete len:375 (-),score=128.51 TRINITY_DN14063_c0_g1_i1:51-1175(-)
MGPKKGNKNKDAVVAAAAAPAPRAPAAAAASPILSSDLADLVNKKIREFERNSAEESEKSQKAQKGKARAIAKTKLKEAKQICNGADLSDAEKIRQLLERLGNEDTEAETLASESEAKVQEISGLEKQVDASQAELNKTLSAKSKLESLLRNLQQQTNALEEERRRLTDAERQRRQDLADEFQQTIANVRKKMDDQAAERSRLALENEVLRTKFKVFFDKYNAREKELAEQQCTRDEEVKAFEQKLRDNALIYRTEVERERRAKAENETLTSGEENLKTQLVTYTKKFQQFEEALSKSDKVLTQYKRQKGKMERKAEVLEKENAELRVRNERKTSQILKERDSLIKSKEELQERCKALQSERQQLNEEVQRLKS